MYFVFWPQTVQASSLRTDFRLKERITARGSTARGHHKMVHDAGGQAHFMPTATPRALRGQLPQGNKHAFQSCSGLVRIKTSCPMMHWTRHERNDTPLLAHRRQTTSGVPHSHLILLTSLYACIRDTNHHNDQKGTNSNSRFPAVQSSKKSLEPVVQEA